MRQAAAITFGFGLLLSGCQTHVAPDTQAELASTLERDLDELLAWFPGVYDNFEQIEAEREGDLAPALRHRHLNHTFSPVEIDGIPGRLLYAQQYQHHDAADLYRQRIYAFEPDLEEGAVRLTIYTPNTPADLTDIHLAPDRQAVLSVDDFYLKPGCEVFWTRSDTQFDGYLKPKACSYYSTRYEAEVFLEETLSLRRNVCRDAP